ncbi:NADPH-dependent FMN reductase [Roseivirga sp. BDSF3-8]|uniref:NADPH-dependent FMN reductase n=1 Tax=Roseivirga sp. BDSF3-8 TaxID=3241598 RepID=UPI003531A1ED
MYTIISGTNRNNSVSAKVSEMYRDILKDHGIEANIIYLTDLPDDFLFSALYENTGKHKKFNEFTKVVNESEKFVFVVAEYNGSFPGVLKAFIDGLDYQSSLKNKKCALVGISAGDQGGGLALSHLTDILNYLGMHVLALKPRMGKIGSALTENKITNPLYKDLLLTQAEQLIGF